MSQYTKEQQADIEALAVRYQAYLEAVKLRDSLGIRTWGPMLVKQQEAMGIELLDPKNIEQNVRNHTAWPE